MGDVKAMPGHPIPLKQGEPNLEIVKRLEALLEEARSGKLLAFAYCNYKSVDMVSHGWIEGAYGFHLVAAIKSLDYRYSKHLAGDD